MACVRIQLYLYSFPRFVKVNQFLSFNNVFFEKRGKTCKYNKKSIKYAALCNAATFGKITRKRRP